MRIMNLMEVLRTKELITIELIDLHIVVMFKLHRTKFASKKEFLNSVHYFAVTIVRALNIDLIINDLYTAGIRPA